MTTNQTPIPEPTSPTAVVVAKLVASPKTGVDCCLWSKAFTGKYSMELGGFKIAPYNEPGPWLRGDELEAVMSTLKAGDVVEVEHDGHKATGELWAGDHGFLSLWASRSGGGVVSYTQPQTTTNEFGFEVKHWRTTGGDLTLFEYLRRDFGALGGWHPGMGDAQGHEFWRQPEKFAQTALMALHSWAAVHDHQLHDLLERHEDLCLGMGPCDRSGVES